MVTVILDNLAEGLSPEEIVAEYPPLAIEDVRAAIAYAAVLVRRKSSSHCELCRHFDKACMALLSARSPIMLLLDCSLHWTR